MNGLEEFQASLAQALAELRKLDLRRRELVTEIQSLREKVEEMFAKAVRILECRPEQLTTEVEARIRKICDETNGIGWGYHDTLCDLSGRVLPDER